MFSESISTSSATGLRTRRGPPGRASCTGTRSRIFSATRCGPGPAWPTRSRSGPWPGAWWRSGQTSPKLGEDDGALATTRCRVLHQKQMKCFQISRVSMTNWPDVSVPYCLSPYFISVIPTKTRTDSGWLRPAAHPGPPTPPQTEIFSGSQQTIILSARGWGQSMNKLDFHLIWFSTHFRSQECHFWSTYLPQLLKKGILRWQSWRN